MIMRLIAEIKKKNESFRYLGIEYDEKQKEGVFLLYLLDADFGTAQYDDWFLNVDLAKYFALKEFEITEESWKIY